MAELSVSDWKKQILQGKSYLAEKGRLEAWGKAQDYYDNNYADDTISVNLIFAIGRALVPQLYFKTPTIIIQSAVEDLAQFTPVLEAIDTKLITKLGMKRQIKMGILDAFLTNIAVFKFGYHSIATELPHQEEEEKEILGDDVRETIEALGGEVQTDDPEDKKEDDKQRYSYHDHVHKDTPWMLRVRPQDFIVPYGTRDIHSAPWCAFRIIRPLVDVLADPVYKNTEGLKANTMLLSSGGKDKIKNIHPTLRQEGVSGEAELDAVEFWEIWDKRSGKIIVIHEDRDLAFRDEKHGMPIQGLPVEILQFNPTGWDFWGPSDLKQIEQQQLEYNETRTMEMNHKKTAITKILYEETMMDQAEIDKFTSGEQVAVAVKGNPNQVIKEFNPNMSTDLFKVSEVIRQDVSEILGFSRNQAGEFNVGRRTATEAGIIQRALEIRSDERRDLVADLITDAFQRKINPMIFQQWTDERAIEVAGRDGWVKFTGPQIAGDYSIMVIADSVIPLTQAQKQQAAVEALNMFKDDPRVDQNRLYEWVFAQFQGLGMPPDLLLSEDEFKKAKQLQLIEGLIGQAKGGNNANGNARP